MTNKDIPDANRDPITGAPGAHPVGTGLGSAAGAVAGAAVGSVAGPVGAVVGGAVGAIAGGLGGKAAGEAVNPTAEDAYWREAYGSEPYYNRDYGYDDYQPAYRTGYENRAKYAGRSFDEAETDLRADYDRTKGNSRLAWDDARIAVKAAWQRLERAVPGGGSDGDVR